MDDTNQKNEVQIFRGRQAIIEQMQRLDPTYVPPPLPTANVLSLHEPTIDKDPITFDQLQADVPPPMEFVLSPFLPVEGVAFVYAATGLGKTLFTLNLAYAIAQGGSFLKYVAPKPRKVLYIDAEMSYQLIHERNMTIRNVQGDLDFPENWMLITPKKLAPYPVPKIDEVEGQQAYLHWIEKFQIEVIIFDNLSTLSSFDENKSHEWKIVQDFLVKLRTMGKTVIVVHHSGKEKNGYRGTSRMLDVTDVAISLQSLDDHQLEDDLIKRKSFKIVYQKTRHFGGADALPFEAYLTNDQWSYNSTEQNDIVRIVEMVSLKVPYRDIAKELNYSASKVCRMIRKAKAQKLIID